MRKGIFAPVVTGYLDFLKLFEPATKVVVSLSAGGIPGIAIHIAFMNILEELKLMPKVEEVWGTSAGAVVGSAMACGRSFADFQRETSKLKRSLLPVNFQDILSQFFLKKGDLAHSGIIGLKRLNRFLREKVYAGHPLRIPFHCIAYNVTGSKKTVLTPKGPAEIADAVTASMAIPGTFDPQKIGGDYYIDGATYEDLPGRSICEKWLREKALKTESREKLLIIGNFINQNYNRVEQKTWDRRRLLSNFIKVGLFFTDAMEARVFERDLEYIQSIPNVSLIVFHPLINIGFDVTKIPLGIERALAELKVQIESKLYFVVKG